MALLYKILREGKRICFVSRDETMEMLKMCELLGIKWDKRTKATAYMPKDSEPYIYLDDTGYLAWGSMGVLRGCHWLPRVDWRHIRDGVTNKPCFNY